jgi:hypothetical protein
MIIFPMVSCHLGTGFHLAVQAPLAIKPQICKEFYDDLESRYPVGSFKEMTSYEIKALPSARSIENQHRQ